MKFCPLCQKPSIFFRQINSYRYYQCRNCTTLFLDPAPSDTTLKNFYNTDFDYSAGQKNEVKIRDRAKIIYQNLKKLNPKGKTLLDIGSGYGYFLEEMNKKGLITLGLEPSAKLNNYAFNKFQIKSLNKSFGEYQSNKKFDYITLIHVIEHVKNPSGIIQKAVSLLNRGGILFIETPNLNSHLFNFEQKNYPFLLAPDHLWVFSRFSLDQILKKVKNIAIRKTSFYSDPEHLMGILKIMLKRRRAANTKQLKKSVPKMTFKQQVKYLFFDKWLARFFVPVLNLNQKGSYLEAYLQKND